MSFLTRFRTSHRQAEAASPGSPVEPGPEQRPSPPADPAPGSAGPGPGGAPPASEHGAPDPGSGAPASEDGAPASAADEALAVAVLRAVDDHEPGRAIQKAERIARQFQGTHAVLPLMAALQRLSSTGGKPWKQSERTSVEKALGEAVRVAVPTPDQLDRLAELALDPSPVVRRYAMWKLGDIGDAATVPLIEGLRDPDDTVRIWAAQALGPSSTRDLRRAEPLMEALSDPRWLVRSRAATSLARLLVQTTTQAGYGANVAPSGELLSGAVRALERALDEAKARENGPGLEAGEAGMAARSITDALKRISAARP